MNTSIWKRLAISALAVCVVAAAAAPASAMTLRRDGSKAVPFVAERTDADSPSTGAASDGFDWSDAAIGAALGAGAALLTVAGSSVVRGRRPLRTPAPRSGAASG